MKQHFKFEPGDQIKDLTFDPPLGGVIVAKHDEPNAYYVRLDGGSTDVIIHARNLQMVNVIHRR